MLLCDFSIIHLDFDKSNSSPGFGNHVPVEKWDTITKFQINSSSKLTDFYLPDFNINPTWLSFVGTQYERSVCISPKRYAGVDFYEQ